MAIKCNLTENGRDRNFFPLGSDTGNSRKSSWPEGDGPGLKAREMEGGFVLATLAGAGLHLAGQDLTRQGNADLGADGGTDKPLSIMRR